MSALSLILQTFLPFVKHTQKLLWDSSFLGRKTPLDLRSAPLWLLYSVTDLLLILLRLARAFHQEQKPS